MVHKAAASHMHDVATVYLRDRGRIVLPARVRANLGLKAGDRFILTVEADGSLRLVSLREQAQRAFGLFARLAPERRLADELIQERRQSPPYDP